MSDVSLEMYEKVRRERDQLARRNRELKQQLNNIAKWAECFVEAWDLHYRKPSMAGVAMVEEIANYLAKDSRESCDE